MRTQQVKLTPSAPPLPRGNHGLERETVLVNQRARLMEGVVLAVADKGYVATRVEDITRQAHVSRTTFYEQFADKEECFLEAYRAGSELQFRHIEAAIRRAPNWPAAALAGVRANLEALSEQPAYARAFLIEVHAAGLPALAARAQAHDRYVDLLVGLQREAHVRFEDVPEVPREVLTAAIAAADDIVVGYLREGKGDRLLELAPAIAYVHLALAGVPELAREALQTPLAAAG